MNSYQIKVAIAIVMYEKQDERDKLANNDIIINVLKELKEAYKVVKLNDFFDPQFNHLYSNIEKKLEFKLLSEEIEKFLCNVEQNFLVLKERQECFRKKQSKIIDNNIRELEPRRKIQFSSDSLNKALTELFPQVNDDNILIQMGTWIINQIDMYSDICRLNNLQLDAYKQLLSQSTPWQKAVKLRYKELFYKDQSSELHDNIKLENVDLLSESIFSTLQENVESIDRTRQKLEIWSAIQTEIEKELHCSTMVFGSSFTLCATIDSDLDIVVYISSVENYMIVLEQIQAILSSSGIIQDDSIIVKAKCPVLKCVHTDSKIKIDLIVDDNEDSTRFRCSHLLYHYAISDWRFRPLLIAIRIWAKKLGINDPINHSLSSHSLTIMLIHYLVAGRESGEIKDLIAEHPENFSPRLNVSNLKFEEWYLNDGEMRSNHELEGCSSLSELFLGFLSYFANFDTQKYGITISGKYTRLNPILHVTRDFSRKLQHFLIQDPFDYKNAARAIANRKHLDRIKLAFLSSTIIIDNQINFEDFCEQSKAIMDSLMIQKLKDSDASKQFYDDANCSNKGSRQAIRHADRSNEIGCEDNGSNNTNSEESNLD